MTRIIKLSKKDYQEICRKLGIDSSTDNKATKTLHNLLNQKYVKEAIKKLKTKINGRIVLIFGAGPSLVNTIDDVKPILKSSEGNYIVVAVDGAAKALLEYNIKIDVLVTDLDGSKQAIIDCFNSGTIIVVHSHGDNIPKTIDFEWMLQERNVIGSTQLHNTSKVKNFGGFTDGDRAVYLTANLNAKSIILFGFDFGSTVGVYSKPDTHQENFPAPKNKLIKFAIAKELLSRVSILFPNTKFYNYTKGESIENFVKITKDDLPNKILI